MPVNIDSREAQIMAATSTETRLQTQGEQNALKIKQKMAEEPQGTPLENLSRALETVQTPSGEKAQRLIDENIGVDRDSTTGGKMRTSEESARKTNVTKYEKLSRELIDKGYDSLSKVQKDEALKFAETILTISPEIAAIVPADPAQRREFIEDMLRQKGFVGLVKAEYSAKFSDSVKLEDEITPSAGQLEKAKEAERQMQAERDRVRRELDETTQKLERFEPGQADAVELERLTTDVPRLEGELAGYQADLDDASGDLANLLRVQLNRLNRGEDTGVIDAAIVTKKGEKKTIAASIKTASDQIAKKSQLERAKANLPGKKQELADNLVAAEAKMAEATRTRLSAQANVESLKEQRREKEQEFVSETRDIIPEAVAKYIKQQLQAAENAQMEIVREMGEKSTDIAQKAISNQIFVNWEKRRTPTILNRSEREINTAQINLDMSTLLDPDQGPATIITEMIQAELKADVAAGKMTQNEVDQIIQLKMKDKEFIGSVTPSVVGALLRQRLKIGTITEAEQDIIINSDWGKGMLQKAMESNNNPQIAAEIDVLKKAGVVKPEGMDAPTRKKFLWMILVGGLAAGIAIKGAAR